MPGPERKSNKWMPKEGNESRWVSWSHRWNCFGYPVSFFPSLKLVPFLWLCGFSHLHLPGRSHLIDLQEWGVIHQGVYWTIFSHCSGCLLPLLLHWSGRLGRLQLTTVFPLWLSFISCQLKNVYWLFSVHIHCCTWLNKNLYNHPLVGCLLFPQLTCEELSYITYRRSGQASDTDRFWTRWFTGSGRLLFLQLP